MIQKQKQLFYFVGDVPFKTLEEAQKNDLKQIIIKNCDDVRIQGLEDTIADFMLKNAAAIVDTLTTTPTSRTKARKANGGKKTPKRPKLQPADLEKA